MIIPRWILPDITKRLTTSRKGIVIYGARQVGKTTLVNNLIRELKQKTLTINGDQNKYIDIITSRDLAKIQSLISGYELVFIDEAQRIPEIGIAVKIIIDNLPSVKVIVTGSSALDLASKISEPLTGRVWPYHLYPISYMELSALKNDEELRAETEERLIYGSYPEIFSLPNTEMKRDYLTLVSDAYLFKDIFDFGGLKNSGKIRDLLKLLAFQIGSQVSLTEIGSRLEISKDTVHRYIEYLEKSFVIFRLQGFSRNLRKETTKMNKVFFYDLGIRNMCIGNMNYLKNRNDQGQLWENYLIVERMKRNAYLHDYSASYFWRTHTGAELDYLEEKSGKLYGYELKSGNKKAKPPASWLSTYPNASYTCINKENYAPFLRER